MCSQINNGSDIHDFFSKYVDFIQANSFENLFGMITDKDKIQAYKSSMLAERLSFLICFCFKLKQMYDKELLFMRKASRLAYANASQFVNAIKDTL